MLSLVCCLLFLFVVEFCIDFDNCNGWLFPLNCFSTSTFWPFLITTLGVTLFSFVTSFGLKETPSISYEIYCSLSWFICLSFSSCLRSPLRYIYDPIFLFFGWNIYWWSLNALNCVWLSLFGSRDTVLSNIFKLGLGRSERLPRLIGPACDLS